MPGATIACVPVSGLISLGSQWSAGHWLQVSSPLHCITLLVTVLSDGWTLASACCGLCVTLHCGPCLGPGLTVATVSPRHPRPESPGAPCLPVQSSGQWASGGSQAVHQSHTGGHHGQSSQNRYEIVNHNSVI